MKFAIIFSVLVLSQSCITMYSPRNVGDQCTRLGMTFDGVSITHDSIKYGARGEVHCRAPQTEVERCNVEKVGSIRAEMSNYNRRWSGKNLLIGAGYAFYFLPGYLIKRHYEDEAKADYEATKERILEIDEEACEDDEEESAAH